MDRWTIHARDNSEALNIVFSYCTIATYQLDSKTFFDSSSFPSNPKLRIVPAFGAFSRGCCDSAFRYASCIAFARAACKRRSLALVRQ